MPNRLFDESSPYLLQHAHNPVDWYPWGTEALERARAEDRPILLSVGYAACHWCHVMERESFADPGIARIMNERFVCIKVDREERPDLDSIYMAALQALSGQGGWPMTLFLTPSGQPFFGGTYFPPADRGPVPGFPRVLHAVADYYGRNRIEALLSGSRVADHILRLSSGPSTGGILSDAIMDRAYSRLRGDFDSRNGGMGTEPKFPQPMVYEFLLRHFLRTGDPEALEMVELALQRMARGGIYDQLGGGFHRYSTDARWLVPHFEKMLYDNALLARLYLHAYQVTGGALYRRVAEETLDYVLRDMTGPAGEFYCAEDADSEGAEGAFYLWRPWEMTGALGVEDGGLAGRRFGVTPEGHLDGRSVLHVAVDARELAVEAGLAESEVASALDRSRAGLLEARTQRSRPMRDDMALAGWNGLMVRALAEASVVLDRDDYRRAAKRNAAFLLDDMRPGGRLARAYYQSGRAHLNGYLEDHAFVADGLLALHEATLEPRWLLEAISLSRSLLGLFWEEGSQRLYDTSTDHEALLARPSDAADTATPSGSSMAAEVLLRVAVLTGEEGFRRPAVTALRSAAILMERAPAAAGQWLCALDFHLSTPREIVIVGRPETEGTRSLLWEVFRGYLPNRVVAGGLGDGEDAGLGGIPLLEARRRVGGRPTAYVCRNYACNLPTTDPEALAVQLRG